MKTATQLQHIWNLYTKNTTTRYQAPDSNSFSLKYYDSDQQVIFSDFHSYDQYMVHLDLVRIMHLIIVATPGLTPQHLHNTEGGCYSLISILLL